MILSYLVRVRDIWSHLVPFGAIWSNLEQFLAIWRHLEKSEVEVTERVRLDKGVIERKRPGKTW